MNSKQQPFHDVAEFGTIVVDVPGLRRDVIYVTEDDVALVRAGLDPACRVRAAAWVWARALDRRTAMTQ